MSPSVIDKKAIKRIMDTGASEAEARARVASRRPVIQETFAGTPPVLPKAPAKAVPQIAPKAVPQETPQGLPELPKLPSWYEGREEGYRPASLSRFQKEAPPEIPQPDTPQPDTPYRPESLTLRIPVDEHEPTLQSYEEFMRPYAEDAEEVYWMQMALASSERERRASFPFAGVQIYKPPVPDPVRPPTAREFAEERLIGEIVERGEARERTPSPGAELGKGIARGATYGVVDLDRFQDIETRAAFEATPLTTAEKAAGITGELAGGFLAYGTVAGMIGSKMRTVGALAKFEKAHPFVHGALVRNFAEEMVDISIRKGTGQEYTAYQFMAGMTLGSAFEGVFAGMRVWKTLRNGKRIAVHLDNLQDRIAKDFDTVFRELGKDASPDDVVAHIMQRNVAGTDIKYSQVKERFLIGLKKKGRSGIDQPAPLVDKDPYVTNKMNSDEIFTFHVEDTKAGLEIAKFEVKHMEDLAEEAAGITKRNAADILNEPRYKNEYNARKLVVDRYELEVRKAEVDARSASKTPTDQFSAIMKEPSLNMRAVKDFVGREIPAVQQKRILEMVDGVKTAKDKKLAAEQVVAAVEEIKVREFRNEITSTAKGKKMAHVRKYLAMSEEAAEQRTKEIDTLFPPDKNPYLPEDIALERQLLTLAEPEKADSRKLSRMLDDVRSILKEGHTQRGAVEQQERAFVEKLKNDLIHEFTGGKGLKSPEEIKAMNSIFEQLLSVDNNVQSFESLMENLSRVPTLHKYQTSTAILPRMLKASRNLYINRYFKNQEILAGAFEKFFLSKRSASKVFLAGGKRINFGKFKKGKGKYANEEMVNLIFTQSQAAEMRLLMKSDYGMATYKEMGWTKEMFDAIETKVDPDFKAYGDWLVDEFLPYYSRTVAPGFERKFGRDFDITESYWPIRGREGIDMFALGYGDSARAGVTPGGIKPRMGSVAPFSFDDMDIFRTITNHLQEIDHFVAFEGPIRMLRGVFGDGDVRKALTQYHGDTSVKTIDHLVENIANDGRNIARNSRAVDFVRKNFTRAKLYANSLPFMKQITSDVAWIPRMPDASVGKFFDGKVDFWKHPIEHWEVLASDPRVRARYEFGSINRDIRFLMKKGMNRKLITGEVSPITDSLIMPTKAGDKIAIIEGGWSVYKSWYDQGIAEGLSHKLAHKRAMDIFVEGMDFTQQSGWTENLSRAQTSGSVHDLYTMFRNAVMQYFRATSNAARGLAYGRGSVQENAKTLAINWVLMPMMVQFVADRGWNPKRQMRAAIAGPMNAIPIGGDIADAIVRAVVGDDEFHGKAPGPIEWSAMIEAVKMISKELRNGDISEKEMLDAMMELGVFGAEIGGVPANTLRHYFKTAIALGEGEIDDPSRFIWRDYALKRPTKKSRSGGVPSVQSPSVPRISIPSIPSMPSIPTIR